VLVTVRVELAGVVPIFSVEGLNPQVTAGELVEHVSAAAAGKFMLPLMASVTFADCPEAIVTDVGFAETVMIAGTVVVGSVEELLSGFMSPPPETPAMLARVGAALPATVAVIAIGG
jgi:hypothetical protein